MYLGKVVGTVVSTSKDQSLVGTKLLLVQRLTSKLEPIEGTEIAVDSVGAGTGELVIVSNGSSARYVLGKSNSTIDAAIVGIVDNIESID
ncbi:MAG: ethanolamine utilization protein EutN/carboxysome structural protein Ccml [Bacillota bacterium]|jgi:ethanolamine utilization protein EutN|nr:ethanolamine utilization protein EutN/carboxysome structural protein Ccml [Bacillota bacterium]